MDWNKILLDALYLILTVLVPVLVRYCVVYLNTKAKKQLTEIENENIKKYLDAANDAVSKAVLEVCQTYADELKKNRQFTAEAHIIAKDMALAKAKDMISVDCEIAVKSLYGDFDAWINANIEAMVRESKYYSIDYSAAVVDSADSSLL